jgi:hypothetical protein
MISSASLPAFSSAVRPAGTSAPVHTVRLPPLTLKPAATTATPGKSDTPSGSPPNPPTQTLPRGSLLNLTV